MAKRFEIVLRNGTIKTCVFESDYDSEIIDWLRRPGIDRTLYYVHETCSNHYHYATTYADFTKNNWEKEMLASDFEIIVEGDETSTPVFKGTDSEVIDWLREKKSPKSYWVHDVRRDLYYAWGHFAGVGVDLENDTHHVVSKLDDRKVLFTGTAVTVRRWLLIDELTNRFDSNVIHLSSMKSMSVEEFFNRGFVPEEKSGESEEAVEHPSHYNQYDGLEIIDLCEQMNFNRGNAVKYITRAGFKDSDKEIEDLEKARFYLKREIKRLKRKEKRK